MKLNESKKNADRQRYRDIRKALRLPRELGQLAEGLKGALPDRVPDDVFRAELLLGYMAGLPNDENGMDAAETAAERE